MGDNPMNMIVCMKQVIDPEIPPASFKIMNGNVSLPSNVSNVIDPYSEYALEAALKIKDTNGGKITVISMGTNLLPDILKKSLSMGADELIFLEDEAFIGGDSWTTAYVLAMAIRKLGNYDLILCGRQASDWDAGQVGSGIAEILELPSVTVVRKISADNGKVKVERVTDTGYEVIQLPLPALVTVSNEIGQPRYPTIKGIMGAKKKDLIFWKAKDIGVKHAEIGTAGCRTRLLELFQPIHEGKCEIVEGETVEEAAVNLALKLRQEKIL
jgi:electron transfer flavoprotein beta subunit